MVSVDAEPPLTDGIRKDRTRRKTILFFTSSEYGQANVILATMYELLLLQKYDLHIASFAALEGRVKDLNEFVPGNTNPILFHTIYGPSALEAITAKNGFIGPYPPGVRGALNTYRVTLPAIANAWDGPTYMKGYQSCLNILHSVDPDLVVVDPLMSQGLEACNVLFKSQVILSPNTFQEICRKQQPLLYQFCRYPAISSAFPYPVPWHLILANVYLKIMLLWILITSPSVRSLIDFRKSQNLPKLPPSFDIWQKENHYLVPSIPETDYPCYVPENVTSCGPILLPVLPVAEVDSELYTWLKRSPTILINLGSHIRMDGKMVNEFASSLKTVLDQYPSLQVLWKLKTSGGLTISSDGKPKRDTQGEEIKRESLEAIAVDIKNERVKVMEWMSVDPLAVLQTGHIVCSVHHGGSNSFHEALSVGVPQVVLPCWLDTLEFANRVEWLGIGVYGSRSAAPSVKAEELSRALMRVLGDGTEALRMRGKAQELAKISGHVGGRRKACERIVEFMEA